MSRAGYRFYLPTLLDVGRTVELPERISRQLARVLRLRPGDSIVLFDGRGVDFIAKLQYVQPERALAVIQCSQPSRALPAPPITLLQALLRHDHFDLVIEKATELGVVRIVPLRTQRVVVHLDDCSTLHRLARWQRIASEASEQCGRGVLPDITAPYSLRDALGLVAAHHLVVFWEGPDATPIVRDEFDHTVPVAIAIGPEGGWAAEEIEFLRHHGAALRSLGPLILRAETAAIAGIAAVRARTVDRAPDLTTSFALGEPPVSATDSALQRVRSDEGAQSRQDDHGTVKERPRPLDR